MIQLTDEQWERIRDHFPEEAIADGRPGRKPTPTRCVLEAVLWILNTGAQWPMLPQSYPRRPRLATGQIIRTSAAYIFKVARDTDRPGQFASCETLTERSAQPITGIR